MNEEKRPSGADVEANAAEAIAGGEASGAAGGAAPATPRRDDVLELDIERLALGGQGLARHARYVIFVDDALPGDRVRARIVRRRSRHAEAMTIARIADGPDRVEAPCAHYRARECGGCRVQDFAYEAQLVAKEEQVRETLAHLGGLAGVPVAPIVGSPERFGYRNKMEFSFQPGAGGEPLLGLHRRGRFDQVFELDRCWICSPLTNAIVRRTQEFARRRRWPAYDPRAHQGLVRFLVVRHLPTTEQALVDLIAADEDVPGAAEWAAEIAGLDARVRSVVLDVNRARAHIAVGEPGRGRVLHGDALIEERLLGLSFEVTAAAFLQTNSRQAEALYAAALEEAELSGEDRAIDVYCGAGTITLALARRAREVIGIESVPAAVHAAERNARRNGIDNARFLLGEARPLLREWREPWTPDVAVVDPPRAGLHPRVIHHLARLGPRRIVYVSCHPGTLARDLALFAERGYATERVRPFDLFPHTPHIEVVARLTRRSD